MAHDPETGARQEVLPALTGGAFEALLRRAPEAALVHDGETIRFANLAATALLRVDPVGARLASLVSTAATGPRALLPDGRRLDVELETEELPGALQLTWLRERRAEGAVERALQETTARLEEIERIAQVGSWEIEHGAGRTQSSRELWRMFDLDRTTLPDARETFERTIHPEDLARARATFERAVRDRLPFETTLRLRTATGGERHVHARGETFFAPDGAPLRTVGTVQDVTHHQRLRAFEQIASLSTGAVALGDERGTITYVSDAFVQMWGYDRADELVGRSAAEIWADPGAARVGIGRLMESGSDVRELVARTKSGEHRSIQLAASRVVDALGATIGFLGLFVDVTDRRAAEEQLAAQRALLQQLVDASPDWIFALDEGRRYLLANRAFAAGAGVTPAEMLGRPTADFWPPEVIEGDRPRGVRGTKEEDEEARAGAVVHNPDRRVRLATGEERVLDVLKGPLRARDGGPIVGHFAIGRDVTEARRRAERVEELSLQLQAMLDAFPDILFRLDGEGRIVDARAGAHDDLAVPADQLIGRRFEEFVELAIARRAAEAVASVRATGAPATIEYTLQTPAGPGEFEARFVRGAGRDVLIVVRNITARREAERRLARSEQQLRQAQKLDAIGRLAGGLAHDFNNMLSVVLSVGGALQQELPAGVEARELVDELLSAGERAAALTRQLLGVARLSPAEPVVIELPHAVQDFSRFLQRVVGEQVRVELQLAPETLPVRLDPSHLEQILLNFAVNARDSMPDGGRLIFRTRNESTEAGMRVVLEATDTGAGMDEAVRARVFEPFFTTKAPGKGTGLGLATVYGIVRQAGGDVVVESSPGAGATFRVVLPPEAHAETCARDAAASPSVAAGGLVLLVEDDPAVRSISRRLLRAAGYEVEECESVAQALARLAAGLRPALLVTDIIMPEARGTELARSARALLPALPILFVSGHVPTDDELAGLGPLVRKPFTRESLLRAVAAALAAP